MHKGNAGEDQVAGCPDNGSTGSGFRILAFFRRL